MLNWLSSLYKRTYKARIIANPSSCTTMNLFSLFVLLLSKSLDQILRNDFLKGKEKKLFWSIKTVLILKKKLNVFNLQVLLHIVLSTLYTMLPHNSIKGS